MKYKYDKFHLGDLRYDVLFDGPGVDDNVWLLSPEKLLNATNIAKKLLDKLLGQFKAKRALKEAASAHIIRKVKGMRNTYV